MNSVFSALVEVYAEYLSDMTYEGLLSEKEYGWHSSHWTSEQKGILCDMIDDAIARKEK